MALGHTGSLGTPAQGHFAVTPSDTVDFTVVARSLFVAVAGDVTVVAYDGTVALYTVPAGAIIPVVCRRVNDTGTDASMGIVGLY